MTQLNYCISFIVLLSLCIDGVITQSTAQNNPQSMTTFNLYFVNISFSSSRELTNKSSMLYNSTRSQITQALNSINGSVDDVVFSDGGGCVKAFIQWRNGDQSKVIDTSEKLKASGILVNNQTWMVSFSSCAGKYLITFKYYVIGLRWTTNYSIETSDNYKALKEALMSSFSTMGGSVRTIKFNNNQGCVEIYLEWEAVDPSNVLELTSKLRTDGLNITGQKYNLTNTPCLNATVNATDGYKIRISGVLLISKTWTDTFNDSTKLANLSSSVKSLIQNVLNNSLMVQNVRVRVVSPYRYMNKTISLLSINIYLTDDHANEHLRSQEMKLANASLRIDDADESIIIARLGRQNITGDPEFCSGVSCRGICKVYSDDQSSCSCDLGYHGVDCSSFDCRSEISMIPNTTVNYCKNNGTCSRAVGGFKCTCPPGRYGNICEAKLCDFLNNPCSGQGVCVGSISDGNLCQCNSSRSGLFCETDAAENLTSCEVKRRFMTFINSSVHAVGPVATFKLQVKDVLKELDVAKYQIPYCLESGNTSTNKQFYSQCSYDVETRRQLACSCLSLDGTQNDYSYHGISDCRANAASEFRDVIFSINIDWPDDSVKEEIQSQLTSLLQPEATYIYFTDYTGRPGCVSLRLQVMMKHPGNVYFLQQTVSDAAIMIGGVKKSVTNVSCDLPVNSTLVDFKLSVANLNWTESYINHSSDEYKTVQAAIQQSFENLNGSLRTLEIAQSEQGSCIVIYVQWLATNITNFLPLMDKVKNTGLQIKAQNYSVSKPPCNTTDESSMLQFKIFVQQLPWSEEYKRNNSNSYKDFQTATSSLFKDIGGNLLTLNLIQRQDCVEVFIQWSNANASRFLSAMNSARQNGLQLGNMHYKVSTSCLPASVNFLNLKLYSNTFTWNDSYKNESSFEYQSLQKEFLTQLSSIQLGAKLVNFKLNSINGCVELSLGLNETSIEIQKLLGGITLNGSAFTIQSCSAISDVIYSTILWNITLNKPYGPEVEKQLNSSMIENTVNDLMMKQNLPGYISSKIKGFLPEATKSNNRAKRESANTVVVVQSNFTGPVPVSEIFAFGQQLKSQKIPTLDIVDITFGFRGPCPSELCSNMSICVSLTNGTQKCACSDMYYGQYCNQKNTTLVCSDKVKCDSEKEKCFKMLTCTGNKCEDTTSCISKNKSVSCDPQPCSNNSTGLCDPCNGKGVCNNQAAGKGFQCQCFPGFSGDACEINNTVCDLIPEDFCKKGCIGDLKNGQLCKCQGILAGIWCNKPARTACDKMKVFYDDVMNLQKENTSVMTVTVLRNLFANYSFTSFNETCIQDVCRNVTCREGERCVVQQISCNPNSGRGKCSVGVCRSITKPGVCPNQDISSLNKLLSNGAALCSVEDCYDDSDCDGDEKCCGLCTTKCTKLAAVSKCSDMFSMSLMQRDFISKLLKDSQNQTDPSSIERIVLKRFLDNPLAWNTSCEPDNFRYKPLQCFSDVSNSSKPPICFCVDFMGKLIEGSKPNASDPASCSVKPYTCPYLDPPTSSDSYVKCTSDMNCTRGDKCCSFMGGSRCATPVDVSQLTTTMDKLMSRTCSLPMNLCLGNGTCSRDWKTTGEICACPDGRFGLFCDNSTASQVSPSTACQKKALASSMLATGQSVSTGNGNKTLVNLVELVLPMFSFMTEVFSYTNYKCLDNGGYPSTLCDRFLDSNLTEVKEAECYCVDRNGQEILGTRMSSSLGQPFCGEKSTCPFGNAFADSKGMPQECGNSTGNCPMGYACKRSKYGQMVCCPTQQVPENICKLPVDQGLTCSELNSTRYFFNETAKECQAFNFRGCGGNYNSFVSAATCTARCVNNEVVHLGTCPDERAGVAKGQCKDKCQSDRDCTLTQKCCKLNCAKQCVAAVVDTDKNLKCAFGNPRGPCDGNTSCGAGQYCNKDVCCIQYKSNADFCSVPPLVGEACGEPVERYFFNSSSSMCQKFNYTGCQLEFNNFESLEDCCESCGQKDRCKSGQCPTLKLGSVISCRNECIADGNCPGKKICCSGGSKCGSVCVLPEVSSDVSDCPARRQQALLSKRLNPSQDSRGCDSSHVPSCEDDGTWSKLQCQTSMGVCWCTTPLGNYIEGSMTKGVAICQNISDTQIAISDLAKLDVASVNFSVCQNSSSPRCCSAGLCQKPCPAYPGASCVVDPCGGCTVKHFDENGNQINCYADVPLCLQEVNALASATLANHLTVLRTMGVNLEDDLQIMVANVTTVSSSILPDLPYICQLPVDPGTCKGFLPQWYYDSATAQCRRFIWGMCDGNDNRFSTPEACYQTCNPSKSPCSGYNCSSTTNCTLTVEEKCLLGVNLTQESCALKPTCSAPKPASIVVGPYVPLCLTTGQYRYKQCYGPYCWCINANGTYLNGLTDQGNDLVCTASGAEKLLSLGNCTNNQWPNISCIAACKDKVCPNNPNASCVVDLCSASCETKFIDVQGNSVTCGDDQCKPFSFNESVQVKCASVNPCPNAKPCPQSICKKALEQNCRSPCANCLLDPCTCQPYFVDVKTNQNLTREQCKYLAHGACALQECKVKKDAVLAQLNDFDLENNVDHPPQCTEKGKFLSRQCRGESCQCINAFGQLANETVGVNGTCPAIDEIKKINTTLTFDASFDNVSKENRLQEFKEKCIAMLTELGIDNQTIKYVSDPYKGSVKINITLESDPNSAITDMSVVYDVLVQGLDYFIIVLGNNTISLIIEDTSVSAQTASQEVVTEEKKESSGLSERDKIIIGCVVGIGGGLILITIIVLCVCCYCKKNRKSQSSAYDPIGAADNPGYDKTPARMNQAYEVDEDERYIKVKL